MSRLSSTAVLGMSDITSGRRGEFTCGRDTVARFPFCCSLAPSWQRWYRTSMTQLAEQLDKKLASWNPEVAAQVEQLVSDVIAMADANALDLLPSRPVVQKVLDLLDES